MMLKFTCGISLLSNPPGIFVDEHLQFGGLQESVQGAASLSVRGAAKIDPIASKSTNFLII